MTSKRNSNRLRIGILLRLTKIKHHRRLKIKSDALAETYQQVYLLITD